jgi:hypothetical protein
MNTLADYDGTVKYWFDPLVESINMALLHRECRSVHTIYLSPSKQERKSAQIARLVQPLSRLLTSQRLQVDQQSESLE